MPKKLDNILIYNKSYCKNKIVIVCSSVLLLLLWEVVGHFFPIMHILFTFSIFVFLTTLLKKVLSALNLIFIPLILSLILIDDIVFRLIGGGIHDDAARGWCLISSLITISIIAGLLFMGIIIEINHSKNISIALKTNKIVGYILYLGVILLIVYVTYGKIIFWI